MRALVVSGIWPPDVGGPASHAPDVVSYLRAHGHHVEVVVTADRAPAQQPYPVHWISRSLPKGAVHVRTAVEVARRAARSDIVYTTGMFGRSAAGATLARRPYVVKLTADPAFERARRRGVVGGDVDEFQRRSGGAAVRVLRLARDVELKHAAHVFTPSAYLRALAVSWGIEPSARLGAAEPVPAAAGAAAAPGASPRLRDRRPDARVRGPPHRTEVAARRARGAGGGRRGRAAHRRRGRRAPRARARHRRARARRAGPPARRTAARTRRRALRGCRCVDSLLELGELPAHGRRGARRRHAGARDGDGRCRGGRARRRERIARPGGRREGARRRDPPLLRRRRAPRAGFATRPRGPSRRMRPSVCSPRSRKPSCVSWLDEEAPRALRRPDPVPAAADAEPREEVRRPGRGARPARARHCAPWLADRGRDVHARASSAARGRRAALLARAPAADRAAAARVPARRDRLPDGVRSRRRARRAADRTRARARRRRGARRLAHVDTPLRLGCAAHPLPPRRRRCRRRAAACRRRAHRVSVHGAARAGPRRRAGRGVPRVHRPRAVPRRGAAASREAVGALRRRARAVQERRRARGGVAARCSPRPRRVAPDRRQGQPRRRRRGARARRRSLGARACAGRGGRRDGRHLGARAPVPLGRDGPRPRRGVLPWPPCRRNARRLHPESRGGRRVGAPRAAGRPAALADAIVRVLSDRALAERLGDGARAAAAPWLQTPEEYARRIRELVA